MGANQLGWHQCSNLEHGGNQWLPAEFRQSAATPSSSALPLRLCKRSEGNDAQICWRYPFTCADAQRESTCNSTGVTPSLVQALRVKPRSILLALPLHLCKCSEVISAQICWRYPFTCAITQRETARNSDGHALQCRRHSNEYTRIQRSLPLHLCNVSEGNTAQFAWSCPFTCASTQQ